MKDKGVLLVFSGPSGAGKSTVIHELMKNRDDIVFSVSATTREPRPNEVDGKDYFFISREKFEEMIEQDAFLEHAEYVGNCYGTPAAPIDAAIETGKVVILDIEVQGAAQVMAKRPDCVSVFLCPPSMEELERRLRGRGTDSDEKIRKRLQTAADECRLAGNYQYILINDDYQCTARKLDAIITAYRCRSEFQTENILKGDFAL